MKNEIRNRYKKVFDAETFKEAKKLINAAELSLTKICEELHTTFSVLKRNMNLYLKADENKGEMDWTEIYKTKYYTLKRKNKTRIVFECQSCSYESSIEIEHCPKCGSFCVEEKILKGPLTWQQIRVMNMIEQKRDECLKNV